jgi:DmsE family decaheme c-type cytochrome
MIDVDKPDSTSGWSPPNVTFKESEYPVLQVAYPAVADAEYVNFDQLCMTCHETYVKTFAHNVHRAQKCEDCHGPASRHVTTRGKEPGLILNFKKLKKAEASEVCLKCHEQNQCEPDASWRTSTHAHSGVSCTDCHTAHYNLPPGTPKYDPALAGLPPEAQQVAYVQKEAFIEEETSPVIDQASIRAASNHLGAITPQICYRCHSSMEQFEKLAHPHQMLGSNGFSCDTCHDPHGKIRQETRTDLCLQCHKDAPTMAWHSSTHSLNGVACTDCHNPHPATFVQGTVGITHTNLSRPKRMPMAVEEPDACYKCHPKVYAQNAMPSHHPIKEGKMVCSDCHDGHGQSQGNLKEATVNQVCYRCHADKQGPFAYEHAPVTQDCAICHAPHGTVTNNLLHQPATFLCLRCHSGHRVGPTSGAHTFAGLPDVGTNAGLQQAFFSDCTECHAQIHGSDLPSPNDPHSLLR